MGFERCGEPQTVPGMRTPSGGRHHLQFMVRRETAARIVEACASLASEEIVDRGRPYREDERPEVVERAIEVGHGIAGKEPLRFERGTQRSESIELLQAGSQPEDRTDSKERRNAGTGDRRRGPDVRCTIWG